MEYGKYELTSTQRSANGELSCYFPALKKSRHDAQTPHPGRPANYILCLERSAQASYIKSEAPDNNGHAQLIVLRP